MAASSLLIHAPISHFYPATSGPLINVRVKVTFFTGELYHAMSAFNQRYPRTSSKKFSALV
jgi:hypothetical protein